MKAMAGRQRGMGFVGFVLIGAAVVFAAVAGMKLVPPYLRNAQIEEIFKEIANDSMLRDATIRDVRDSYTKRASINYITDLKEEDIDVDKIDGRWVLSATYAVKIPAVANITLLLEFNPSSS